MTQKTIQLYLKYLTVLLMTTSLYSCSKESGGEGAVLVKVLYNNQKVSQATVYLMKNTSTYPGVPLEEYDQQERTDSQGQAYFAHLKPGQYYLVAKGYHALINATVTGENSVKVRKKYRQNEYTVVIEVHP